MHKTLAELVNFNSAMTDGVQINLYYVICIYIFPTLFVNKGCLSTEKGM